MKAFIKKLTSRKFLSMLTGVATGLWTVCRQRYDTVSILTGVTAMAVVIVAYIITEGNIDMAAVSAAKNAVTDGALPEYNKAVSEITEGDKSEL